MTSRVFCERLGTTFLIFRLHYTLHRFSIFQIGFNPLILIRMHFNSPVGWYLNKEVIRWHSLQIPFLLLAQHITNRNISQLNNLSICRLKAIQRYDKKCTPLFFQLGDHVCILLDKYQFKCQHHL
jgi:hypothetical protein